MASIFDFINGITSKKKSWDEWTDVETGAGFPVPHGTAVTVSCPTGYEQGEVTTVTCDEGTTFTYTTPPSCTEKSKAPGSFLFHYKIINIKKDSSKSIYHDF